MRSRCSLTTTRTRSRPESESDVTRSVRMQFVGWLLACLLNVPATCDCFLGTDLLRQVYELPH